MTLAILGVISGILVLIPIIIKAFTKTPEQKREDVGKAVDKEEDDVMKSGRPE